MSKARASKVPMMKKNQPFVDWRKELKIWQATNNALGVEPKIEAGTLFESLDEDLNEEKVYFSK